MIAMSRWLHNLLQVQRYPHFFEDLIIVQMQLVLLRRKGLLVGNNCSFRGRPLITLFPESRIVIADDAFLVSRASDTALGVNHPVIFRTLRKGATITIHEGCRASGVTICAATSITVGKRAVIGANVMITDTDFHALDSVLRSSATDSVNAAAKPVYLEADVFIGSGAMILKGVTVGAGSVVGAGAIVTSDVPPGSIAAGNPARVFGRVNSMITRPSA